MSTYDLLGFPAAIAVLLFTVALTIALIPLFGGKKIAGLDIPDPGAGYPRWLAKGGWLMAIVAGAMFAPVWAAAPAADDPTQPFAVTVTLKSGTGAPLDCGLLASAKALLLAGTQSYRAAIDGACVATFTGVAAEHRNQDARLRLEGARGFVVQTEAVQALSPDPLIVTVDAIAEVPRIRIAILPSEVQSASPQLQEFREALTDRIVNMSQSFAGRGDAYSYVDRLKVVNEGPSLPSAGELRDFWESSHALQLVRGQVDSATLPLTVHSSIFLGDLAPAPQFSNVAVDVRVTPGDFSRTHDSYSVVMLYALARDAQRLGKPKDVIAGFLSEAHAIAEQLDDPPGQLMPITAAVAAMLQSLSSGTTP